MQRRGIQWLGPGSSHVPLGDSRSIHLSIHHCPPRGKNNEMYNAMYLLPGSRGEGWLAQYRVWKGSIRCTLTLDSIGCVVSPPRDNMMPSNVLGWCLQQRKFFLVQGHSFAPRCPLLLGYRYACPPPTPVMHVQPKCPLSSSSQNTPHV